MYISTSCKGDMSCLWMQFGEEPTAEAVLWVDTHSYNSAIPELQVALQYLEDLSRETSAKHSQVVARVATTIGIVDTYKNSLEGCMAHHGCSYVLFLEDDRCAVCHMLCSPARGAVLLQVASCCHPLLQAA